MGIPEFMQQSAPAAAKALIGWTLVHKTSEGAIGGIIVETEAYTSDDPASHSFRGQTLRNTPMFQPAGTIYVYFTYGMHHCANIVAGNSNGEAVLLRALEPTLGIDLMQKNRGQQDIKKLCSGPAKLVQALAITRAMTGTHLNDGKLLLLPPGKEIEVAQSARIGIKQAVDRHWRFFDPVSPFLSRKQ